MTGQYVFRGAEIPARKWFSGESKVNDLRNFSITNMAMLMIDIEPGALREIHRYPDADELQHGLWSTACMRSVVSKLDFRHALLN